MPERSVELQTWTQEENRLGEEGNRSESLWGIGPLIGITDQLELGLPVDFVWARTPGMSGVNGLSDYGIEARYRLVTQDPQDAPAFAPLLRASVKRLVLARDVVRPELGVVATYELGSVVIGADVAVAGDFTRDDHQLEVIPAGGISVAVAGDLRLGAEVFAQWSLEDDGSSWAGAGPNLAWTHGRFWLSAAKGIGIYELKDAPRMQWGIAF
jgi:hypothetical protein